MNFSSPDGKGLDNMRKLYSNLCDGNKVNHKNQDYCKRELQRAYNYLGRCVGYKNHKVDQGKLNIIFADTLSTLEILRHGVRISYQPREMSVPTILRKIGQLVPRSCINVEQIETVKKTKGVAAARAAKLIALGDCIQDLDKERQLGIAKKLENESRRTEDQLSVEKVLELIDHWCNAWLKGDLEGEDWHTFDSCLMAG